jgi:hypothetical protein
MTVEGQDKAGGFLSVEASPKNVFRFLKNPKLRLLSTTLRNESITRPRNGSRTIK